MSSASGGNVRGLGTVLSFDVDGHLLGPFSQDSRISDPRGLCLHPSEPLVYVNSGRDRILALTFEGNVALDSGHIPNLDPGGAVFGPDGRYYLTGRQRGTVLALPADLQGEVAMHLSEGIVPFPRGFGFGSEGHFYLNSGIGPSGEGDNMIAVFSSTSAGLSLSHLIHDPELSPLDLILAPSSNVLVSSEWPIGGHDACATVREYEPLSGRLMRIFSPDPSEGFSRPRGLRLLTDGRLYCVGKDHIVLFDFSTGEFLGVVAKLPSLHGQAIVVVTQHDG